MASFSSGGMVALVLMIMTFLCVEIIKSDQNVSSMKNSLFNLEEGNFVVTSKILRTLEKISHRQAKCNSKGTSADYESLLTAVQRTQSSVEQLAKSTSEAISKLQQTVMEHITCSSNTGVHRTQNSVGQLGKSTSEAINKLHQAVTEHLAGTSYTDASSRVAQHPATMADAAIQDLFIKTRLDGEGDEEEQLKRKSRSFRGGQNSTQGEGRNKIAMEDNLETKSKHFKVQKEDGKHLDLQGVDFFKNGAIAKATDFIPGYPPVKALYFGRKFWHSGVKPATLPKSLWFEFPDAIQVVKYSFRSRTSGDWLISSDGPSKYIFWASNSDNCSDETQWDKLYEDNSGTPFDLNNTPKRVSIQNQKSYKCYGFKVTDVPGRNRKTWYTDSKVGDKRVTISDVHFYSTGGG